MSVNEYVLLESFSGGRQQLRPLTSRKVRNCSCSFASRLLNVALRCHFSLDTRVGAGREQEVPFPRLPPPLPSPSALFLHRTQAGAPEKKKRRPDGGAVQHSGSRSSLGESSSLFDFCSTCCMKIQRLFVVVIDYCCLLSIVIVCCYICCCISCCCCWQLTCCLILRTGTWHGSHPDPTSLSASSTLCCSGSPACTCGPSHLFTCCTCSSTHHVAPSPCPSSAAARRWDPRLDLCFSFWLWPLFQVTGSDLWPFLQLLALSSVSVPGSDLCFSSWLWPLTSDLCFSSWLWPWLSVDQWRFFTSWFRRNRTIVTCWCCWDPWWGAWRW